MSLSDRHRMSLFQQDSPDTTVGTDGNFGTKKMGLVGEFKFFSQFGGWETGASD